MYFADSSSGLGTLGVNGSSFVIQLITLVLAFLVLRKYAFAPIAKILKERRETIEAGVSLGEKMKQDEEKLEKSIEDRLAKARAKADSILGEAKDAAKAAVKAGEEDAIRKAESILEDARNKTKLEMDAAKVKLESEIAGLVVEATEVLTREKIDSTKDAKLVDQAIKEVK